MYASSIHKKELKYLKPLFTQLNDPVIIKPEPPDDSTTGDNTLYKEEIRQYIKDKNLETTLASLYNLVWGQCSKLMQNKLLLDNT